MGASLKYCKQGPQTNNGELNIENIISKPSLKSSSKLLDDGVPFDSTNNLSFEQGARELNHTLYHQFYDKITIKKDDFDYQISSQTQKTKEKVISMIVSPTQFQTKSDSKSRSRKVSEQRKKNEIVKNELVLERQDSQASIQAKSKYFIIQTNGVQTQNTAQFPGTEKPQSYKNKKISQRKKEQKVQTQNLIYLQQQSVSADIESPQRSILKRKSYQVLPERETQSPPLKTELYIERLESTKKVRFSSAPPKLKIIPSPQKRKTAAS